MILSLLEATGAAVAASERSCASKYRGRSSFTRSHRSRRFGFTQILYLKTKYFDEIEGIALPEEKPDAPEGLVGNIVDPTRTAFKHAFICGSGIALATFGFVCIFHARLAYMGYTFFATLFFCFVVVELHDYFNRAYFSQQMELFLAELFLFNRNHEGKGHLGHSVEKKFGCCSVHGALEYLCLGIFDPHCNPKREYGECEVEDTNSTASFRLIPPMKIPTESKLLESMDEFMLPGCHSTLVDIFFDTWHEVLMFLALTLAFIILMGLFLALIANLEWRYLAPEMTLIRYILEKCCRNPVHRINRSKAAESVAEGATMPMLATEAKDEDEDEGDEDEDEEKKMAEESKEMAEKEEDVKSQRGGSALDEAAMKLPTKYESRISDEFISALITRSPDPRNANRRLDSHAFKVPPSDPFWEELLSDGGGGVANWDQRTPPSKIREKRRNSFDELSHYDDDDEGDEKNENENEEEEEKDGENKDENHNFDDDLDSDGGNANENNNNGSNNNRNNNNSIGNRRKSDVHEDPTNLISAEAVVELAPALISPSSTSPFEIAISDAEAKKTEPRHSTF